MRLTTLTLFALTLLGPAAARAQPTAATAPTQYVDVDGVRIGYRTIGSGSPLLIANRMRGTLDTWDPLFLDELAREHTVITFDYPGVGYSSGTLPNEMRDVARFVDRLATKLRLQRFAVLGWSWGGFLSQTLVLDYPQRVTHAVLVGTNPPGGENQLPIQQGWLDRAFKPVNDLEDEEILFFEPRSESSRGAAKRSRDRIRVRPDVDAKIPSTIEEIRAFLTVAAAFRADDAGRRAQLKKSKTPMLVLCGDNDTSVPVDHWYPLIGEIPRAQLIELPQSGHGPQHQYPELSAAYVAAFLRLEPAP